jgi:chromosome segregation ATPase
MLFAGVFDRLESERHEVIAGLDRFGRLQKELAEQVRTAAQDLRTAQDKPHSDPQKMKELSEALQWKMRIFEERRKTVSYVCETPALIEQRLGALSRAILGAM